MSSCLSDGCQHGGGGGYYIFLIMLMSTQYYYINVSIWFSCSFVIQSTDMRSLQAETKNLSMRYNKISTNMYMYHILIAHPPRGLAPPQILPFPVASLSRSLLQESG